VKGFDFLMRTAKITKKIISLFTAAAMGSVSAVSMMSGIGSAYAADDCNDDWLHAVGSRLYDKNGNEVWLTGANWFGFNCSENCPHGLYAADCDDFLTNVADRGINLIRFPISTELIYSWMQGTPNPVQSVQAGYDPPYVDINKDFVLEDGKTLKNSMEIFDVIMKKCKEHGIKAMIDIHSPHADNSGHNYNLWYGKESSDGTMMTTEIWMDTLTWLADKYKNDDTIIGFDLKNEPHGKGQEGSAAAKWDDSTDENNWAYAATQCANSILSVNPNALIFIEGVEQQCREGISPEKGVEYYWGMSDSRTDPPYYPAWWGGQLRGVRENPVVPENGTSQIVYSPHDYGPSVYAQTWFEGDFTTESLLKDYWYDTWAYINAEDIAPLLIGEWGGFMDGGKNQKWMELLRDYMIENHISHTFWCLNPNSGDTEGLLKYDFLSWDEEKYALFEEALWQTQETGKYIGLDHQKALGANGISLDEFYSSYASSEGSNLDGGTVVKGDNPKPTQPVQTGTTSSQTSETTTTTTTTAKITTDTTAGTTKITTESSSGSSVLYGDATNDGKIDSADVVASAAYVGNPDKNPLSEQGLKNADVHNNGDGVTASDALTIQQYLAKIVTTLPVK